MKHLLALMLCLTTISLFGQIDPQRPTFAESYTIIEQNYLQLENGITYDKENGLGYGTFFRYSVAKRIELRSLVSWQNGLPNAGVKLTLLEDSSWVPGISFVSSFDFNSGARVSDYRLALTQNFIGTPLSLTLNFGKDTDLFGIYILCCSISDRFGVFAEAQQYYEKHLNYNLGATWRITENSQIDIHTGSIDNSFFLGGGYSFRIQ